MAVVIAFCLLFINSPFLLCFLFIIHKLPVFIVCFVYYSSTPRFYCVFCLLFINSPFLLCFLFIIHKLPVFIVFFVYYSSTPRFYCVFCLLFINSSFVCFYCVYCLLFLHSSTQAARCLGRRCLCTWRLTASVQALSLYLEADCLCAGVVSVPGG